MTIKEWVIPIKTVSEANSREHWAIKNNRHRRQSFFIKLSFHEIMTETPLPCVITMTRLSPRLLDDDNLMAAFKHIRDVLADLLIPGKKMGMADSDPRITWKYAQEKSKSYGVRIAIEY